MRKYCGKRWQPWESTKSRLCMLLAQDGNNEDIYCEYGGKPGIPSGKRGIPEIRLTDLSEARHT